MFSLRDCIYIAASRYFRNKWFRNSMGKSVFYIFLFFWKAPVKYFLKLFQTKVFYYTKEKLLANMTICHHVLAKFLTDPLLSCLMKKKDEVAVRKRIFPNRLGEGILISSWGYKALCFIQKPLTLVDFFISILKIGQCPWSRISSNKLLPSSQQWKQIISLFFFFPLQSCDTTAGRDHLFTWVQDYTQVWSQKPIHMEEETKDLVLSG